MGKKNLLRRIKSSAKKNIIKAKGLGINVGKTVSRLGKISLKGGKSIVKLTKPLTVKLGTSSKAITEKTSIWVNAVLSTEFVKGIEQWFTRFNVNKDMYDTAIDSVYNTTHVGGSGLHHIVDGQHSIWGAFKAAKSASPTDIDFQAFANSTEHLTRDMCSVSGINPFLNITKGQFDKVASFTHIPKKWLADALTFNAAELIGTAIATLALVFGWSKLDSKQFAEYAGGLGVAAIVSANPLLGLVVIISAARAFTLTKKNKAIEEGKLKLAKSALKGTVVPSIVIFMSVIIGGPVYIGLILGIIVAVLVRKKMDDKKLIEGLRVFLKAYCLDFIKPKARFLGDLIKETYAKSYNKIKRIKIPKVKVVVEWD